MSQLLIDILVCAVAVVTNDKTTWGTQEVNIFIPSVRLSCCIEMPFCSTPTCLVFYLVEARLSCHLPAANCRVQDSARSFGKQLKSPSAALSFIPWLHAVASLSYTILQHSISCYLTTLSIYEVIQATRHSVTFYVDNFWVVPSYENPVTGLQNVTCGQRNER